MREYEFSALNIYLRLACYHAEERTSQVSDFVLW